MTAVDFRGRAIADIGTPKAAANQRGARRAYNKRAKAVSEYPAMDVMRDRAREIRLHTLANLTHYLGMLADSVERRGGTVHFAADAEEANRIVLEIADAVGARTVVKSKSMVTEEIELNHALEESGRTVTETDLGEFIVQISGDRPVHIIAPVMHKTRQEVGALFADLLDAPYTDIPTELNDIARAHLRDIFLGADMGVTGVNLASAADGTMVTVTNEGNGRYVTSTPRTHVAIMGLERVVPDLAGMTVLLEVLARSATGQRLSVYTNFVTGPRRAGDADGPEDFHLIILDNGRTDVLAGGSAEILACIRCGACLNVCPVYREVGGHAYGGVYPGPLGAVLTPALLGHEGWSDLPFASTLCGACEEVCPVRIRFPELLLGLRGEIVEEGDSAFGWLGPGLSAYTRIATHPFLWRAFLAAGGVFGATAGRSGWVTKLPFHAGNWTTTRDLPAPARQSFHGWWKENRGSDGA